MWCKTKSRFSFEIFCGLIFLQTRAFGLHYDLFNVSIKVSFQEANNILSGLFLFEIQVFLFRYKRTSFASILLHNYLSIFREGESANWHNKSIKKNENKGGVGLLKFIVGRKNGVRVKMAMTIIYYASIV